MTPTKLNRSLVGAGWTQKLLPGKTGGVFLWFKILFGLPIEKHLIGKDDLSRDLNNN